MEHIGFAVKSIGASHTESGLPCQDSVHFINEPSCVSVAAADGHGSSQYFRSDIGSGIAARTACAKMSEFLKISDMSENEDTAVKRLIESIVTEWRISVKEHIIENPFTDEEIGKVPEKYREVYIPFSATKAPDYTPYELESRLKPENSDLLKAYGSTLIVLGMCEGYGIGLHIGDGKCVAVYDDGSIDEPIPWDERCHLNKCTSICDENSVSEFRYHIWRDKIPVAVFAASDGIDDSFADKLHMFYRSAAQDFAANEFHAQVRKLEEMLPQISARGSKDDMSIAGIIAPDRLRKVQDILKEASRSEAGSSRLKELEKKLEELIFRRGNTEKLFEKCSEEYAEKKEKYKLTLEALGKDIESVENEIKRIKESG